MTFRGLAGMERSAEAVWLGIIGAALQSVTFYVLCAAGVALPFNPYGTAITGWGIFSWWCLFSLLSWRPCGSTASIVMGRNFMDVMKALCEGRLKYGENKR